MMDVRVSWISTYVYRDKVPVENYVLFEVNELQLTEGTYNFNLYCETDFGVADWVQNVFKLNVVFHDYYHTGRPIPADQGFCISKFSIK